MASRLNLQDELEVMMDSKNVYFQPPESVRFKYPACTYKKSSGALKHADNFPYFFRTRYKVQIIDRDPDADWVQKMLNTFKYVAVESEFVADNLNHWNFTIYY